MTKIITYIKNVWMWFVRHAEDRGTYGALVFLSFIDSFFFFVPPELMVGGMSYARPRQWFLVALVASISGALGAIVAYVLGAYFFDIIGMPILTFIGMSDSFASLVDVAENHAFLSLFVLALSPIPSVPFTYALGFLKAPFFSVVFAIGLARFVRYAVIAFVAAGISTSLLEKTKNKKYLIIAGVVALAAITILLTGFVIDSIYPVK